jgi:glycopeptide antibiotics resistance protein
VSPPSRRASVALVIWTAVICVIVLPWVRPQNHVHLDLVQWIPFVTPPIRLGDIVLNTLLYVPFGYLHVRRSHRISIRRTVLLATALSVVTEVAQLFSHGRFPSTTDLVCNIAGAYAGALWASGRTRSSAHGAPRAEGGV